MPFNYECIFTKTPYTIEIHIAYVLHDKVQT